MSDKKTPTMVVENNILKMPQRNMEPKEGVGTVMFKFMQMHRDKLAQIDVLTDQRQSYAELFQRCVSTAQYLQEIGITRKDIISLCTYNQLDTIVPFIASQFIGCTVACFDPSSPPKKLLHFMNMIKPRIIFVDQEAELPIQKSKEEAKTNTQIVVFGKTSTNTEFSLFVQSKNTDTFEPVHVENLKDTFAIYFSSGTTGLPKGICLSHYTFLGKMFTPLSGDDLDPEYVAREKANTLSLLSNATINGLSSALVLFGTILQGGFRLVFSEFSGKEIWDIIEKYKPSRVCLSPVQAMEMLAAKPGQEIHNFSYVSAISITGSKITEEKLLEIRRRIPGWDACQTYGQTEACGALLGFNMVDRKHREFAKNKPGSSGLVVYGVSYRIADVKTNEALGPNQHGEIQIKSPFVMTEFYNNVNISDAFTEDGFLKTGDIGYYDEEYCFYVIDRLKEVLHYNGAYITPSVVERHLFGHPDVHIAVLIGVPHEMGQLPVALIVKRDGATASESDIENYVAERVSENERIAGGVKFIKKMPLTSSGKVDRNQSRQLALELVQS